MTLSPRVTAPARPYLLCCVDDLGDWAERVRRYRRADDAARAALRASGRFTTTELHEVRPDGLARSVSDWADGSAGEG